MKKQIYFLLLLIPILSFGFSSCEDDDDNYDKEWHKENKDAFDKFDGIRIYSGMDVGYGESSLHVKYKTASSIRDNTVPEIPVTNVSPLFTDTVVVRFTGWFIDKKGEKIIFDSTEEPKHGSSVNPNKVAQKFAVNAVINGWTTALQNMHEGEEREIWVPYELGYGGVAYGDIPAYTTLRFDLVLVKVIPMSGRS
ncbi:FKBP-type peptidyl-prolyl cis-trans isomerase [Dysgonomonas sp. PH5-45]|uniref:FKBP-type peptidyl-prolyl cis-trans isomerase n=1 Tax=unclassified Dysgonomonas TaxID=2630389 RepID=UPI0024736D47|nr:MULTISPECIES: FKBP-type peptidyl-prolyl cis-trans isomerase [unclassified Dysgonomonas]MDH6355166.1 FKBP-type peptidyl-prolyl cis-trans isomerase [Dysgonomonas sp. PH5-45]MDH6388108.1 FKBP-type peptidyl-prolyl cis-trans isomerase [Dysgonomonas sp. PH5-37]